MKAKTASLRQPSSTALNTVKANSARGEDEVGLKALGTERPPSASCSKPISPATARRPRAPTAVPRPASAHLGRCRADPEVAFPKMVPITVVGGVAGFMLSAIAILLANFSAAAAFEAGPVLPRRCRCGARKRLSRMRSRGGGCSGRACGRRRPSCAAIRLPAYEHVPVRDAEAPEMRCWPMSRTRSCWPMRAGAVCCSTSRSLRKKSSSRLPPSPAI